MTMVSIVASSSVLIALAGCATTVSSESVSLDFERRGTSTEETTQDIAACTNELNSGTSATRREDPGEAKRLLALCMEGKGYTVSEHRPK